MDIKTIRKMNVLLLEREIRSRSALARMAGTSQSYLSQCVGPAAIRSIGDQLARRLEHAMNKPHGWLDEPHSDENDMMLARRVYDRLLLVPRPKLNAIAELLDVRLEDEEMPIEEAAQEVNQKPTATGRVITLEDDGTTKKRRGQ
jgi:hypothetical protein